MALQAKITPQMSPEEGPHRGRKFSHFEAGHRVLFLTLDTCITRLKRAQVENRLERQLQLFSYPKILILDDEPIVGDRLKPALEKCGYHVETQTDSQAAIDQLESRISGQSYGFNLIHSPNEPDLENALVDLYLRRRVSLVEASAFLALTPALVRYRTHGLSRDAEGRVVAPNRVIGKVSREEVAAKFFAPPPERFLRELVDAGHLSAEQAQMAAEIPLAQDVTVESDSGGHTDNRPALALLPTIQAQRNACQEQYNYREPLRVGLGGGIATPAAAAAAFAMGAAYLVTGSINQACVESGTCDEVRQMLADTRQADVIMAPSGDMFEMGVKVQVIKRGTMFSMRAAKLYELYKNYNSIEELPVAEREKLEKTVFRKSLEQVWEETRSYFEQRDPQPLARAERDPKHKLALVFRWYLGQSPDWANRGVADRKLDYQIWCGPAIVDSSARSPWHW